MTYDVLEEKGALPPGGGGIESPSADTSQFPVLAYRGRDAVKPLLAFKGGKNSWVVFVHVAGQGRSKGDSPGAWYRRGG